MELTLVMAREHSLGWFHKPL